MVWLLAGVALLVVALVVKLRQARRGVDPVRLARRGRL